ncbi:MFS transporter [bacterium]|nr:MFS transporter [bacterium]
MVNLLRSLTVIRLERHFWLLFVAYLLVNINLTLFYLLPLRIEDIGGTRAQIGWVMGIAQGGGVLIRLLIGSLLDRYGRRPWLILSSLLVTVASFLYLFVSEISVFLYFIRIVHGFGSGMLFAAFMTAAVDNVPTEKQIEVIGLFGIAGLLPMVLGPMLGEYLLSLGDFTFLFIAAIVLSTISLFLTFFLHETLPEKSFGKVLNLSMLGRNGLVRIWVASFLFGAATNATYNFLAPFTRVNALSGISVFFGYYVLTSTIIRLFLGKLPEKLGVRHFYRPAALVLSLGVSLVGLARTQTWLMVAGSMVGVGQGFIFPILITLATRKSSLTNRGMIITMATLLMDLGGMVTSPLLGFIGDLSGYPVLFLIAGLFSFIAAFIRTADR